MCSIILSCFTIQHDAMEITVTCHSWSLKITILGTKQVSRKMGTYHIVTGKLSTAALIGRIEFLLKFFIYYSHL